MRNCYLAVAERDLLLPSSLTSRLLNRAPIGGIATGRPEDWTVEELHEPTQLIADRIEYLIHTNRTNLDTPQSEPVANAIKP